MRCSEIDLLMREFYAARERGDVAGVLSAFTADAGFQIGSGSQASPTTIKAVGVDEFRPLVALLIKTFKLLDLTIRSVTIDDDRATVHWRANVRSRITGATVPTDLIDIVEFRDGRIVSFNEVFEARS